MPPPGRLGKWNTFAWRVLIRQAKKDPLSLRGVFLFDTYSVQ
jgi:hypothetical protein